MSQNDFEWLLSWYHSQCDGDWEHSAGINIKTLDNPGWAVFIDLEGTELENIKFEKVKIDISDTDWLICFTENSKFQGFCGTFNLLQVIHIFREWAENDNRIKQ